MKNLIVTISFGLITASAQSMVWQSDGTPQNIQFIHDNRAVDGDTITIPSGTFTWTTQLTLTKAITIQGNTTTNSDTGTFVDNTIIMDNTSDRVIKLTNGGQRITGITFTSLHSLRFNGGIYHDPANTSGAVTLPIRIDHNHFITFDFSPQIVVFTPNFGVLDHNVFTGIDWQSGIVHCSWQYYNGFDHGDGTFNEPAGFGGPKFFFIENNYVFPSTNLLGGGSDCTHGGKLCWRYNECFNVGMVGHGTSRTFEDGRGGRAYEDYENKIHNTWQTGQSFDGPDSGSMVVHVNHFLDLVSGGYDKHYYYVLFTIVRFRLRGNAWITMLLKDGTHVDGHSPLVFETEP
jgi:hypothetical protein